MRRPLRPVPAALRELGALARRDVVPAAARLADRALRRRAWSAPLRFPEDRTMLLFFEDFERDRLVRGDRLLRRGARKLYHALTAGQTVTGFEMWFRMLVGALGDAGWRVVVNDHALARRNPGHPVGIVGYPHVLDRWRLPNPAVLGPGLLDHPSERPALMEDPRYRVYLTTCEWLRAEFERAWPGRCATWFGGFDAAELDPFRGPADVDFLIYDKVRWDREARLADLVRPIFAELDRRGLRHSVLRYGGHAREEYLSRAGRARGLLFLCEHETQGMAYQEALALGVPVLAWDPGVWIDPRGVRLAGGRPVPATSVPYFDSRCGERFRDAGGFPVALDRFLERRAGYAPRRFVEETLSRAASAAAYVSACERAARRPPAAPAGRPPGA